MNYRPSDIRRGYVLLMTLALLVMASTLLVAVGRISVRRALSAELEQQRLQRKWGLITCRQAVLPYAEPIMAKLEATGGPVARRLTTSLFLTDQQFELILDDEQAKANLNFMLQNQTVGNSEDRLRDVLGDIGMSNAIRLRPVYDDAASPVGAPTAMLEVIHSFGQVVSDASNPAQLSGAGRPSPVGELTLWGDGAINVLRADESALRLALWPTLSRVEIGRLLAAREKLITISRSGHADALGMDPAGAAKPSASPTSYLISQAQIDPKSASRLSVTDHSTCHSLWILARDRQRVWYDFSVADDSMPQHPRRFDFTW